MSPPLTSTGTNLRVLRPLEGDPRVDTVLAEVPGFATPLVLRVVKADVAVDADAFVARSRKLAALEQPSLRPVRGSGKMADGRPYVLLDPADAGTLAQAGSLALAELVALGIHLAKALSALHASGLTLGGKLSAEDVCVSTVSTPPLLDASLCGLAMAGAAPEGDARALADLLLAHGAASADPGSFESKVRRTLQSVTTVESLAQALAELQSTWRARTAVSGKFPALSVETPEPDLTGTLLGAWQLERMLGEGAMGRVYLARHQRIGREAAVKVLKAEHARSADLVHRFIQEATAVNAIKNEHIVEVSDFGEQPLDDGSTRVYCVMELLEGSSLADAMEKSQFAVQRAAKVCQAMARALHAAHQVGVVHRDIKPENIFLIRRGSEAEFVKVLDFGVAKLLKPIGELPRSGTQAGIVIGTPDYMAPEQALGAPTDFRVDLYAVGLVLYELLCRRRPFVGDTFGKLVVEMTTRPVPPLPARTPQEETIPAGLAQVVMKCLAREPADRFQSGEALAAALAPFTSPGLAATTPAVAVPAPAPASELFDEPLPALRSSPLPKVVSAVIGLAVLGFAGYVMLGPSAPEPAMPVEAAPAPAPEAPKPVAAVEPPKPVVAAEPPKPVAPPAKVSLEVKSTPPGATVREVQGNVVLGLTPLKVELPPRASLALRLELDGHLPASRDVALSANVALHVNLEKAPKPRAPVEAKKPSELKKGPAAPDGTVDPFSE